MSNSITLVRRAAEQEDNPYHYTPSLVMAIIFLVIFALSSAVHTFQTVKGHHYFMHVMAAGGLIEILGWAGRLWSRYDILRSGYIMQMCTLVIGPTFISAALYILLGIVIERVAPANSPLSPKWFKITFLVADGASLVIQGIGGGMAGSAEPGDAEQTDLGGHIMLTGILFQLVVMVVYSLYAVYWGTRSLSQLRAAGPGLSRMLLGMTISSLAIILRGGFRTAELVQGWRGALATDQLMFLLDAIPVSVAMIALNVFHPTYLLPTDIPSSTPESSQASLNEKTHGMQSV